jgi:hypothetical protein
VNSEGFEGTLTKLLANCASCVELLAKTIQTLQTVQNPSLKMEKNDD